MKSEWKECTIGDLCSSVSDTYHGNDEKVVLVNTSDVLEGKILNHKSVENKNLKGQFKKTFKKDDILYSEIRPANKRYAYVDFEETKRYIASTKLMVLRPNINLVLPRFLFAFLTSNDVLTELQHLAETRSGTFPQITFSSELASMPISVPCLDEQQKIAGILSSLDDKIELNNRINENLEQQTRAIFKSWFIDYDYDYDAPNTWKKGVLEDISVITTGKRPLMKSNKKTDKIKIPIVGATSIIGFANKANYNDKILVIGRVGTHGVIQRFNSSCWVSDNALIIQSKFYEYTYQILKDIDYNSIKRGSTQPLITQCDMKKIAILIPDQITLEKFENIAGRLMIMYEKNLIENEHLAEIRDTLLPRLMSGELDVSEIDI